MAYEGSNQIVPGFKATATLAAKQFYILQLSSTAGELKLATSGTSRIVGVIVGDAPAGEAVELVAIGMPGKVAAETSVSVGSWLTSSSTGRAKATTTEGDTVIGQALEATSTAGDIIKYLGAVSRIGT
jgi:hypothetical protein